MCPVTRTHRLWAASLTALALVVVGVLAQLMHVHVETGQWGVSVSAARAPSRVHFEHRDYDQAGEVRVPRDAVRRGRTDGGGTVYKPAGSGDQLSVIIYVSDGKRAWMYGLSGGP